MPGLDWAGTAGTFRIRVRARNLVVWIDWVRLCEERPEFSTVAEAMKKHTVANPASPDGAEQPVRLVTRKEEVTDRAHRYRANKVLDQIPATHRNRCHFCGVAGFNVPLMPGHIDGHEENNEPWNISPTCRSCNSSVGANFARAGIGRRTRQFNPTQPIRTASEYRRVIDVFSGSGDLDELRAAIAKLQATSHAQRNRLSRELGK